MLQLNTDDRPLICGVGLGGYWRRDRIGFLCDVRQAIFNPNLFPAENMERRSTGLKSMLISGPSASTISARKTAIVVW